MIQLLSGLKSGQGASADRVWIAGTSILFFALGLVIVCFLSLKAAPIALMAALGASAVGAIIGFLFGIPRRFRTMVKQRSKMVARKMAQL